MASAVVAGTHVSGDLIQRRLRWQAALAYSSAPASTQSSAVAVDQVSGRLLGRREDKDRRVHRPQEADLREGMLSEVLGQLAPKPDTCHCHPLRLVYKSGLTFNGECILALPCFLSVSRPGG